MKILRLIVLVLIFLGLGHPQLWADTHEYEPYTYGKPATEDGMGITEQDRFTDLVTFMWKHGDKEESYGVEVWNLTLKEDECSGFACLTFAYLSFAPGLNQVILTVEKEYILEKSKVMIDTYKKYGTIYIPEGSREVDHMFYTSYFNVEVGAFSPLPNTIVHSVVILSVENELLHMETEAVQVMEDKGHENEEWTYWIERFYEYRLEVLSKGEAI